MLTQRTIKNTIQTTGIGLHSGEKVFLTFHPASDNHGVVFKRSDVPDAPAIKVHAETVVSTQLATTIAHSSMPKASISTVEHLMSALCGLGIDNIFIEVSAPEIPIMDGSAAPFIYLIQKAGIVEQEAPKKFIKIKKAVDYREGDKIARLEPYDGFKLDFTIDFNHPVIEQTNQKHVCEFTSQYFIEAISRARTFGFMRDLEMMREKNLALGGSMDNAIVVDDYRILNNDGLRYDDEFVRHKVLDAVGDLYMLGHPIMGKFTGYKAGHGMNNLLIRELMKSKSNFEFVTFEDATQAPIRYLTPIGA